MGWFDVEGGGGLGGLVTWACWACWACWAVSLVFGGTEVSWLAWRDMGKDQVVCWLCGSDDRYIFPVARGVNGAVGVNGFVSISQEK